MLTEPRVLIIEADPHTGAELQAVMRFIERTPVLVDDCSRWAELAGDTCDYQAVFVGSCDSENELAKLLSDIHQRDQNLPIYLLAEKGREPTVRIEAGSCILGRIELPPSYSQLTSALHQAEVYAASHRSRTAEQRPVDLFRSLVGSSRAVQNVRRMIQQVADSDANVLILGESGTGKEVVARNLHYHSSRRDRPFVPVNCGAIPHDLLESELFGHVKGSFTGATESRSGFFLTAEGGTVFLDEIGETSHAMQVKLLRVLQDKQVRMVGASRQTTVDVRIIVATNKDLALMVREGAFRDDLYFRINVIPIHVPPLRDRNSDIALLTNHFASRFARELGCPVPRFSDRVMQIFESYSWPGNVRELENIVQRLVVMTDSDIVDAPDLPSLMRFSVAGTGVDLTRTLAVAQAEYIRDVLLSVGGNKTRAAQILGIDRKTLRTKL